MKTLIYDGAITEGLKERQKEDEGGKGEKQSKREWFAGLAGSVYTYIPTQSIMGRGSSMGPPYLGMPCPGNSMSLPSRDAVFSFCSLYTNQGEPFLAHHSHSVI